MDNMSKSVEKQLEELSLSFIAFFEKLKQNGIINQQEYDKHTIIKKNFLNNLSKSKSQ